MNIFLLYRNVSSNYINVWALGVNVYLQYYYIIYVKQTKQLLLLTPIVMYRYLTYLYIIFILVQLIKGPLYYVYFNGII